MNIRPLIRTLGSALLVTGLCFGTAALANELATIKIEASVINKKVIETSDIGIPTEEVTVSRRVGYSDLNLTTHLGTMALRERVKKAAELACKQIDELYPLERSEAPQCIKDAIAAADRQVDEAIAAAHQSAE
jgi:UrcA family protein